MISLWRDKAPQGVGPRLADDLPLEYFYPSGRQALTAVVKTLGLERPDRVALPDWSSHCVISAIGKMATPAPMKEVLQYAMPVSCVLLYEQWGWPFPPDMAWRFEKLFPDTCLILDAVDSADILSRKSSWNLLVGKHAVVFSLAKTLGLKGGGVALVNDRHLKFVQTAEGEILSHLLWNSETGAMCPSKCLLWHKSEVECLHPELGVWLARYSANEALEKECRQRLGNLRLILESAVGREWPSWMKKACDDGAAPGVAPILRNQSAKRIKACQDVLRTKHDIESCFYNFNWSGDPLSPDYGQCLAIPVHGLVTDMSGIVKTLEHIGTAV